MTDYVLGFSVAGAVKASGIARSSLYLAMKDGSLVARKYGKRTIIEADELRRFLATLPLKEVEANPNPTNSIPASQLGDSDDTV